MSQFANSRDREILGLEWASETSGFTSVTHFLQHGHTSETFLIVPPPGDEHSETQAHRGHSYSSHASHSLAPIGL